MNVTKTGKFDNAALRWPLPAIGRGTRCHPQDANSRLTEQLPCCRRKSQADQGRTLLTRRGVTPSQDQDTLSVHTLDLILWRADGSTGVSGHRVCGTHWMYNMIACFSMETTILRFDSVGR